MGNEEAIKLQIEKYNEWKDKPSKENMSQVIKTLSPLIHSELNRYQGTLDKKLMYGYAKNYAAEAVKSYDPKSGNQLSTHVINNLQRLHRLNARNVQSLRAPEVMQGKYKEYQDIIRNYEDINNATPTDEEISKELGMDVNNLRQYIRFENPEQNLNQSSMYTENAPEDELADYIYHDLPDDWKYVFEHRTGYNGSEILKAKDIAKKLDISPVRVSQMADTISRKMISFLNDKEKHNELQD